MTNLAKWNAALSWASALTTELNSLANGSCAVASAAVDNTTNLNTDGWVSFSFPTVATGAGAPNVQIYLLPLNEDGTTYGDGTASGSTLPAASYLVATIGFAASLASGTRTGQAYIGMIPPNSFKLVVVNNLGNALAATANVVKFAPDCINLNS